MIKTIYLAGGCFWGMERAMQFLDGVVRTTVGYANGNVDDPDYKLVCTDTTGHRETVRVEYDDEQVSLNKILKAYFICIDPTVTNRQGGDIGSQYQTGVYYVDEESRKICEEYFAMERTRHEEFHVELCPLSCFWDAEEYHQKYLVKNPGGYCHVSAHEFEQIKALNEK
ncbi:MAG: peptide-methionine (S)-S-oxide reductase MsrA [Erysipelotrichaceae bacterium]|nr:peptide-methionine (S)-S-oxide reductase MsrA [Erysipelotrichaceae bacterium]MBQ2214367.1 peptide-methionine (S)-S-oxide reductase MsrA [Erysipelotrichaceae bacterium]